MKWLNFKTKEGYEIKINESQIREFWSKVVSQDEVKIGIIFVDGSVNTFLLTRIEFNKI